MYKPARQIESIEAPKIWAELPSGEILRPIIQEQLKAVAETCFGYHLVKLGNLSSLTDLPSCKIKHQVKQPSFLTDGSSVVAKPTALPYREKSVDAFLLVHELDFSQDPHQVLREIDRCLIPNGHLIIVGYNPYSLAGLSKLMSFKRRSKLNQARFFSRNRVKDWLGLLGYQVTEEDSFAFSELVFNRPISDKGRWQLCAKKYLSFFASLYVMVGKKREVPLSLLKPAWKPKPKFTPVSVNLRKQVNANK